jgi:CubicO group peptidase (beta-lactamase class C family)
MKDSFFFPPAEKHARIASVYELKDGKLRNLGDGIYRKGAKYSMPEGGLYATASDMYAFYQMMLSGGALNGRRILSRASVETMTQVHTGDLRPSYGLSWAVAKGPAGTLTLAAEGAFGHGGAFGTYGWIDPRRDLIGVFMIQRFPSGSPDEQNAFRQLAAASVIE